MLSFILSNRTLRGALLVQKKIKIKQAQSILSPALLLARCGTETSQIVSVCGAGVLTTSASSRIHKGARRLLLKTDRQRHRQGDERRKAG